MSQIIPVFNIKSDQCLTCFECEPAMTIYIFSSVHFLERFFFPNIFIRSSLHLSVTCRLVENRQENTIIVI